MDAYCSVPPATPTISNAIASTASTTIHSITQFSCNMGYTSDGDVNPPYFMCLANNATQGIWSTANWGCSSAPTFSLINLLQWARTLMYNVQVIETREYIWF